jgi:hypothetical protein
MLFPNPLVKVSCPENEMKTHTEKRDSIELSKDSVKNPIKQALDAKGFAQLDMQIF